MLHPVLRWLPPCTLLPGSFPSFAFDLNGNQRLQENAEPPIACNSSAGTSRPTCPQPERLMYRGLETNCGRNGHCPDGRQDRPAGHRMPGPTRRRRRWSLVELFTSEGCSSGPPADALLRQVNGTRTPAGQLIVGISEHVTYWNSLGWSDPFFLALHGTAECIW